MKFEDGKARQRTAVEAAVATVARMIAAHLERAGYVIKPKPPLTGPSAPGAPSKAPETPTRVCVRRPALF